MFLPNRRVALPCMIVTMPADGVVGERDIEIVDPTASQSPEMVTLGDRVAEVATEHAVAVPEQGTPSPRSRPARVAPAGRWPCAARNDTVDRCCSSVTPNSERCRASFCSKRIVVSHRVAQHRPQVGPDGVPGVGGDTWVAKTILLTVPVDRRRRRVESLQLEIAFRAFGFGIGFEGHSGTRR